MNFLHLFENSENWLNINIEEVILMPYNEFRDQAERYFEIAKDKLAKGNKAEARNQFNMAKAIAEKEGLTDLVALINSYLNDL